MGRRSDADAGAALFGMILLVVCAFSAVTVVIAIPVGILSAPAFAIYLSIKELPPGPSPVLQWWAVSVLSPLVAVVLVWASSPERGWLRGRPAGYPEDAYRSQRELAVVRALRRRALLLSYARRTGLVLGTMTVLTLITLVYADLSGRTEVGVRGEVTPDAVLVMFGPPTVAVALLLLGLRIHDRRPYREPVTADVVHAAAAHADSILSGLRAETTRMESITEQVSAVLSGTGYQLRFVAMCDLHFESFNCADRMHDQYRSANESARLMADILARCRAQCRRQHGDAALAGAGAHLERAVGPLEQLASYGLDRVRTLNSRTADLKYSIRDNCGDRGYRWYEALEERVAAARSAA